MTFDVPQASVKTQPDVNQRHVHVRQTLTFKKPESVLIQTVFQLSVIRIKFHLTGQVLFKELGCFWKDWIAPCLCLFATLILLQIFFSAEQNGAKIASK